MNKRQKTQMREALVLLKAGLDKLPGDIDTREITELCNIVAELETQVEEEDY